MVFSAAGSGAFASLCRLLSVFLLVCAQPSVGDVGGGFAPKFITATTPGRLQDAISAGVQHVLITGHMDMTKSPLERDMDSQVQALNGGIGRLKETTRSIGGWCSEPPPPEFNLREPVPPGACAILVGEDFLDIPIGTRQFWMDSVYVAIQDPGTGNSSVLVLHVDGDVWITNSVFQGAGNNSRAVDVTTKDDGSPRLYVADSVITGFTRELGPGIIAWWNPSLMLERVAFKNITLLPKSSGDVFQSSAITMYNGSGLLMQDVTVENNVIYGEPAGHRAIGIDSGPPPAVAFSDPRIDVYQRPNGRIAQTDSVFNSTTKFLPGFNDGDVVLSGIKQERAALLEANNIPPLQLTAPLPAPAPAPAPTPAPAPAAAGTPAPGPTSTAPSPPPPPLPPSPRPELPLPPDTTGTTEDQGNTGESTPATASGVPRAQAEAGEDDGDDGVNVGAVVGISLAAAAAVALCITVAALLLIRRRRQSHPPMPAPNLLPEPEAAVGAWPHAQYDGK